MGWPNWLEGGSSIPLKWVKIYKQNAQNLEVKITTANP